MSEGRDEYGGGEFEEKFIGLHVVIASGFGLGIRIHTQSL